MLLNQTYYDFDFVSYPYQKVVNFPAAQKVGLDKYTELLPFANLAQFSLGEGQTPLTKATQLASNLGLSNLFIKHEELNPTGSFKDRESLVAVAFAAHHGLTEVSIASSGNAALSLAAYARKAGLNCICFVPKSTSVEKKQLITFFGGQLHEIEGNYEQVYRHVVDNFDRASNLTAGINQERVEANKTIAYEIWEDLGHAPEVVIVPCGNGGNLAGIGQGFWELQQLGMITKLPKMIAVQVAGAAPLTAALSSPTKIATVPDPVDSLAEGIVAEESYCSPKAVDVLTKSGGAVIEVNELEIKQALKTIVETESLILEPTSAAAFAALPKLAKLGIRKDATTVVVATGSGMKMLEEVQHIVNNQL